MTEQEKLQFLTTEERMEREKQLIEESKQTSKQVYFSGAHDEKPEGYDEWEGDRQCNYKAERKKEVERDCLNRAGYELQEEEADGNCLFRAVADIKSPGSADRDHMDYRKNAVDQLELDIAEDQDLYEAVE